MEQVIVLAVLVGCVVFGFGLVSALASRKHRIQILKFESGKTTPINEPAKPSGIGMAGQGVSNYTGQFGQQ